MEETQKVAKTSNRLIRAIKQSRLCQVRAAVWYLYGSEVLRDYKGDLRIDNQNGTSTWQEAIDLELEQIKEYPGP